ncbi:glycerol-3-phosphate acyltransferase 2, mitochondrial isoform X2 [Hyperolius riggenbachi]
MGSDIPQLQEPAYGKITSRICSFGFGMKIETVSPFQGLFRPIVGRACQSCSPKSMENFFYKRHTRLGFSSVIRLTEAETRYRGWLVRRLCCVIFIWERSADQDFSSQLTEKICKHPSVMSAVNKGRDIDEQVDPLSCDNAPQSSKVQLEVLKVLGQIQKSLSPLLIRLAHWVLVKVLQRLYLNVQLHSGQVATLREVSAACPKAPLVFLSSHPSWLDGFLVPFLLYSQSIKVPRVAWDWTDCPRLYRYFLQKLGTIFLPSDGPSMHLSEAVLFACTETLLADGHSLLVFLESCSSSSCHILAPVASKWMKAVMAALQSGAVPDVLIVPVGISYDSYPEIANAGTQVFSIFGFGRFVLSALCPWTASLGCARVDFAQPFSLQEYISNYTWKHVAPAPCLRETLLPFILGARKKMYDEMALAGIPDSPDLYEQTLVNGFIMHSLRAAVFSSAIMAPNMLSALLLHKYRDGIGLSRLLSEFTVMVTEILLHGFDVGFSGQRWDLLRHSLYILRNHVTLYSGPSDVYVVCRPSQHSIRELGQRSAALLPVFLYEAIGACAVHALLAQLPSLLLVEIFFTQEELNEIILCLCALLPKNILLLPPCQSLYGLSQDVMDKLIQCGFLSMYEDPNAPPACDTGRRRFVDSLMWRSVDDMSDSDSDLMEENVKRHYKLGRSNRHADFFVLLCHLLGPLLKTYEKAALYLQEHGTFQSETESNYVDKLQEYLQGKAEEDGSYECTERSLASCAVETFKDLGVFQSSPSSHGTLLSLSEPFLLKENCDRLVAFIQQFIYKD